jgi:hypothetical protein
VVTHRRLIAVYLKCKCCKSFSRLSWHPWKREREVLLFYSVPDTTRDYYVDIFVKLLLHIRISIKILLKQTNEYIFFVYLYIFFLRSAVYKFIDPAFVSRFCRGPNTRDRLAMLHLPAAAVLYYFLLLIQITFSP